jgi:phospholipid transport system substrate-binding protein
MLKRRQLLLMTVSLAALAGGLGKTERAWAQASDKASAFVKTTGDRLVGVVNGAGSATEKRASLTQIIDNAVDVEGIARFCLGRFWKPASPDQQKRYVDLFHQVLVTNITSKLGEYQGVRFTVGKSVTREDEAVVSTTVERPNNPMTVVDWVVAQPASAPKIVDVVAEGTSLRLTQRSDYAAYLSRNNSNVDALITAMKQQIAQGG